MPAPIPPCRFCGADLRRAESRIIVRFGPRGKRQSYGVCGKTECLKQFELPRYSDGDTTVQMQRRET